MLFETNEGLQKRILNKIAIPKIDFDLDEEDVEIRYSEIIKWFIVNLPKKIKITNESVNQFKIPNNICNDILYKNNNHMYLKMDLQIYLKRRNINVWTIYNNFNEVEVYYSFII